jgi:hypothetical protein
MAKGGSMAKLFQKILMSVVIFFCLIALTIHTAKGNIITMAADYEYSGGIAPAGTAPWIAATFDDHDTTGSITLTLIATNLIGTESVVKWDLNLDPALDPVSLNFSAPTKIGNFDNPTISTGINSFNAGGGGNYDIQFAFTPGGNTTRTFSGGDSVSYEITLPGITANSFNFLSDPTGGHGPYLMAAHVQNTPNGGGYSGWIAPGATSSVPEPSSLFLLGMGTAGLLLYIRRQRKTE